MKIYPKGTKVVPHTKSIFSSLDECLEWNMGKEQGFLYVVDIDTYKKRYTLSATENDDDGNYYAYGDVTAYTGKTSWDTMNSEIKLSEGVVVELDWRNEEKFKTAIRKKDSLVCMSLLEDKFVTSLYMKDIKKLHKFLGEIIEYEKQSNA